MTTPNKAPRVHISGDGTIHGTTVTDLETGAKLPHISGVAITHRAGQVPHAVINVIVPSVEVTCEAELIASPAKPISSDAAIEAEIQAKGPTAPRVTLADLNANIAHTEIVKYVAQSGQVLRWAILTTRSGYAVTGRPSVSVSPENDKAEIGEGIAIDNARQELWPLMGYALKERLAQGGAA